MADQPQAQPVYPITDPDNVPVRIINGIPQIGPIGGLIALTLSTVRIGFSPEGKIEPDFVLARLRLDLDLARQLRDQLDGQIRLLTAPPDVKAN